MTLHLILTPILALVLVAVLLYALIVWAGWYEPGDHQTAEPELRSFRDPLGDLGRHHYLWTLPPKEKP